MTPEILYSKWLTKFIDNDIPFKIDNDIIKFDSYNIYTPFTYKFTFNMVDDYILSDYSINTNKFLYEFKQSDYKLFADLFFIDGWEDELKYQLTYYQNRYKIKKPNQNFSDNYGDITYYIKPWVDYVTFQGFRTMVQFKFDKYERYEKLKQIEKINKMYDNVQI